MEASTYGSRSLPMTQGSRSFWERQFFPRWLKEPPPPRFPSVTVQGLGALHPALKGAQSHLHRARRAGGPYLPLTFCGSHHLATLTGTLKTLGSPCVQVWGTAPSWDGSSPLALAPLPAEEEERHPHLPGQQCPPSGPWLPHTSRINCFFRFQRVSGNAQSEVLDCISRGFPRALKESRCKTPY